MPFASLSSKYTLVMKIVTTMILYQTVLLKKQDLIVLQQPLAQILVIFQAAVLQIIKTPLALLAQDTQQKQHLIKLHSLRIVTNALMLVIQQMAT